MTTSDSSDSTKPVDQFEAELRETISPAQPLGADRIDDDGDPAPPAETFPPNVKHEHSGRMKH